MTRPSALLVVSAAALCCVQCSVLLDLPADCTPDDCDGFQCNEEGTGCLTSCGADTDCAAGHLCDRAACSPRGCEPDAEPVVISESLDGDVAASWGGGRLGVATIDDGVLNFRVFLGTALEASSTRQLEAPSAKAANPSVAWNGSGWAIAWESELTDADGRHEVLRFATVDTTGQQAIAPKNLWVTVVDDSGVQEKSVDDPNIAWHEASQTYVVVWSTRKTSSDIYMMFIRRDGTDSQGRDDIPHGAALRVTLTEVDSINPIVSPRAEGVYDIVYRQGSGNVDTVLRTVNTEASLEGSDVNLSSAMGQVTSHGYARTTKGSVIGFTVENGAGVAYRTQLRSDRTIAGDKSFTVDREFSDAEGTHAVSSVTGEYAIVTAATRDERPDVYIARFLDNGARIGLPFPVTSDRPEAAAPVAAATPDGYAILHREATGVLGRHWTCERVEE